MPKTIVVNNLVLLLCLSVLAGGTVVTHLGGDVSYGRHSVVGLTLAGGCCGIVMLVSEFFSGIRWVPIVALASLIVGWLAADGNTVSLGGGEVAWLVGWVAVAAWFAYLAAEARENR